MLGAWSSSRGHGRRVAVVHVARAGHRGRMKYIKRIRVLSYSTYMSFSDPCLVPLSCLSCLLTLSLLVQLHHAHIILYVRDRHYTVKYDADYVDG